MTSSQRRVLEASPWGEPHREIEAAANQIDDPIRCMHVDLALADFLAQHRSAIAPA